MTINWIVPAVAAHMTKGRRQRQGGVSEYPRKVIQRLELIIRKLQRTSGRENAIEVLPQSTSSSTLNRSVARPAGPDPANFAASDSAQKVVQICTTFPTPPPTC